MIQIHWILRQMPTKDLGSIKIPDPGILQILDPRPFLVFGTCPMHTCITHCHTDLLIRVQKFQVDILKMTRIMIMTWRVKISHFSRHLSLFCKFQLLFFDRFRNFEKCFRVIIHVLCENLIEKHVFHHNFFSTLTFFTTLSPMIPWRRIWS